MHKLKPTVVLGVAVAVLFVLSACSADVGTSASASTPPPSVAAPQVASEQPSARTGFPMAGEGEYEPGIYWVASGDAAAVAFTFTVPAGWVGENGGQTISKHPDQAGEVGINSYIVTEIDSDACAAAFEPVPVGPLAGDLATALARQPGAAVSGPVDINLGGYPAQRIDLTIPGELDLATCRLGSVGLHIWEAVGGKNFVLYKDGSASVYVADVGGNRAVFSAQRRASSTADDIAEMISIIESIEFELPRLAMPGPRPDEPAGQYGWTGELGSRTGMHKHVEMANNGYSQTQMVFAVENDCFASGDGPEPVAVTVAGLEGGYVEPYDGPGVVFMPERESGQTTGGYALPVGDRTLCVYLTWDPTTTTDELNAARQVVESIRGQAFGPEGIRIVFTLPEGWDTG